MGTPLEVKKLVEAKQEEPRESVRVSLVWCTGRGFVAEVFNNGDVDMYINEMALCHQMQENQLLTIPLLVTLALPVADGKGSVVRVAPGHKNYDLPRRKEVEFVLPRFPSAALEGAATGSPDDVWLVVTSYGGEVYRVLGGQVQRVLTQVLELWRVAEETEKPRNATVVIFNRVGESRDEVCRIRVAVSERYRSDELDVTILDGGAGWNVGSELWQQLLRELAAGRLRPC